jgi:hypothetical protein
MATPWWSATPLLLFFFSIFFKKKVFNTLFFLKKSFIIFNFLKFFFFIYIFLHYDTCLLSRVDTCPTVSFLTEKLMEILISSFSKLQVPSVIRMKVEWTKKNKNFKPLVPIRCLTLYFFSSAMVSM